MSVRCKALVVEDDKNIGYRICHCLRAANYETLMAETGTAAGNLIRSEKPDVVLLDLNLPDMDGIRVLTNLRMWSSIPVIVVSCRNSGEEKVTALDMGADDYVTKPFDDKELEARIRVAIRHKAANILIKHSYAVGELEINYERFRVYINGKDACLTQNEFRLVALLGQNAGKVVTYNEIIKRLWGVSGITDNQILRVNMANIRHKIEEDPSSPRYILTETGVGYRMVTEI